MPEKDLPFLKLFVNDFLGDERLVECSAAAHGVYIRLMLIMTKSETYGKILLKQKYKNLVKQKSSKRASKTQAKAKHLLDLCFKFAFQLAKAMPFEEEIIESALIELAEEKVVRFEGDYLYQKRMVRDHEISIKRSVSGKSGGKKSAENRKLLGYNKGDNLVQQNDDDLLQQNSSKSVISVYSNNNTGRKGGLGEKQQPENLHLVAPVYKVFNQTWEEISEHKSFVKGVDPEDFEDWKDFVRLCGSEEHEFYKEIFTGKFLFPKDFAKLKKEKGFTREKWIPVLEKLLSVGMKPEHIMFFRIPEVMKWSKSDSKNGAVRNDEAVKQAGSNEGSYTESSF